MRVVLWEFAEGGSDLCVLERGDDGWRLHGTALLVADGAPVAVRYAVAVDREWVTRDADVAVSFPGGEVRKPFETGDLWSGAKRPPDLRDCVDVDLGFTPATNTLPIRRLRLDVGEAAEVAAVWLRWPELTVERLDQRYERLARDRYRYSAGDFSADIVVDDLGLVVEYDGLWRSLARR